MHNQIKAVHFICCFSTNLHIHEGREYVLASVLARAILSHKFPELIEYVVCVFVFIFVFVLGFWDYHIRLIKFMLTFLIDCARKMENLI